MTGTLLRRTLRPLEVVRAHPLTSYVVLAIASSWAFWVPLAVWAPDRSHLPGLVGPLLAGVLVTAISSGPAGLRALLERAVRWRVASRWWAVAVAPLALGVAGVVIGVLAGGDQPSWAEFADFPGLPDVGWPGVFVLVLLINAFGEEVGWRGFAWPTLRRRHSMIAATLRLWGVWAVWHLPLFFIDTALGDLALLTVTGWLLGLLAGTLVLGWLLERSGSLLVVAVFHTCLNMASATTATEGVPAAIASMAVIVGAVWLAGRVGSARARTPTS